jgi:hypothetical protein
VPAYNNDATLEADVQSLKYLGFNSIISYEPLFIEDPSIICLVLSRTHKLASLCDTYGMKLLPCVWGTKEPKLWVDHDLDNVAFKDWLSRHLARVQTVFGEHECFGGLVWDDFGWEEWLIDDWTDWTNFIESRTAGVNVFDDHLGGFSSRVVTSGRVIKSEYYYTYEGHIYPPTVGRNWTDSSWARNVQGGIVLQCFGKGWNPYYLSQDLDNYSGNFVSCYAWRRGSPETNTTLFWKPDYWNSVTYALQGT